MIESKATVASRLVPQLRDRIARGLLRPNAKLRLQELADLYGVSLSAVRETLVRLSADGLVTGEDQRGFRVAETSIADLIEVTTLRVQFEPYALRLAINRGDAQWEENLVAIFHRLTKIEKSDDYVPFLDDWEKAHREFHMSLIKGCGMPMLHQFCSSLHDMSDRYRRIYLANHLPPQRDVVKEHAEIIEAVLARDADKACQALAAHSQRTGSTVLERLKHLSSTTNH